ARAYARLGRNEKTSGRRLEDSDLYDIADADANHWRWAVALSKGFEKGSRPDILGLVENDAVDVQEHIIKCNSAGIRKQGCGRAFGDVESIRSAGGERTAASELRRENRAK